MDFRELNYVLAIAKKQNITKAAESLYVSQPTLSKFLTSLEEELELKLFQRVGNKYLLTYAGKRYIEKAQEILQIKKDLDVELMDIRRNGKGVLNVGFPSMRSFYILPYALPAFQKKYPNVQVNIVEGTSKKLDQMLLDGELDLAFYSMPPTKNPQLEYERMGKEELVLCIQKNHPLKEYALENPESHYPFLDLDHVKEYTLLHMSKEQRTGQFIDELLQKKHFKFKNKLMSTSMLFIMELVSCGYGVTFLFEPHVLKHESHIPMDCYSFDENPVTSYFVAAGRKDRYQSEFAREFIGFVRESNEKFFNNNRN